MKLTDTDRLNWLEETLVSLHRVGPYMSGENFGGQLDNKAKLTKGLAGPPYFRIHHRDLRSAIDEAMAWPDQPVDA